jgi:1-acyl-sn-glycerol-3-phosphate acyltransferase
VSRSNGDGAEILAFDPARRSRDGGTRPRCTAEVDGRPCRNHAGPSGFCRVHEPAPRDSGGGARDAGGAPRSAHPAGRSRAGDGSVARLLRTRAGDRPPGSATIDPRVADALRFLRRRLTGDYDVDVYGFDRELTEQVVLPLFRPLYRSYWRIRTSGLQHVPDEGGALLVANHSGALPFDAIMTKVAVLDDHPAHRHLRLLAADFALRMPVVGPLARKTGNTLAHNDDALRLLRDGELVGVWPEGFKGIGKPYRDRYKLQRFGRGGFVEVALRAQVPIVPVAIIGAEEIYPIVANLRPLARLLGAPYFPITWQFPLLGPLGLLPLPSQWMIDFGEPIDTTAYGPEAADDPMVVFELVDRVRDTIQQMLYRNLVGRRSIFFA